MDDPLELKLKLAEYESKCGELEAQVSKLKERVGSSGSADDILDLKTKLSKAEGRADGAESTLKGTKHQLQQAIEKAENLQEELNAQKSSTHKAEMKVEDLSRKLTLLQHKLEESGADDGSKGALEAAARKADDSESKLKGAQMKLQQALERVEDLTEEVNEHKSRASKAEMQVEDLNRKIRLLQEQVAGASTGGDSAALGTAEKRADALESELKGTKMKLVQATEKYEQAQEDLALAKETARKAELKAEEADRKNKMLQGSLEKANERYTAVETRLLTTMKEVGALKAQLAARV
eukprot:TRINITY_DN2263_c0_g2_i1.p1 TRINITY_DN2263_c0_g2~~TRINITY_DN2263_c0_g2_i1.p1  ORF type:complete len:295 (+),score=99.83 TRINITY_DN2263_c0_g2_i1:15-899(+)